MRQNRDPAVQITNTPRGEKTEKSAAVDIEFMRPAKNLNVFNIYARIFGPEPSVFSSAVKKLKN
jgi:hypothetical protein